MGRVLTTSPGHWHYEIESRERIRTKKHYHYVDQYGREGWSDKTDEFPHEFLARMRREGKNVGILNTGDSKPKKFENE